MRCVTSRSTPSTRRRRPRPTNRRPVAAREARDAEEAWVVTTASSVTDQAEQLADATGVRIERV